MKVAIIGGTHGNEKTGSWLLSKWKSQPELLPSQHDYFLDFGNPQALEKNLRYVDFDLNRSFNGGNPFPQSYEFKRAQELSRAVFEWTKGEKFFLIDLHTTTSNMGASLIISDRHRFNAWILKQVHPHIPESRLIFSFYDQKNIYLSSLSPYSLMVEVGPAPQNLLLGKALELMEESVLQILKHLPATFDEGALKEEVKLQGFLEEGEVLYPGWSKEQRPSYIHPDFQGQDFKLLKKGMPIFKTQTGKTLFYEGETPTYPTFINEAAYYEKGFAFTQNTFGEFTF